MKLNKRVIAMALCALLALSLFVSSAYIVRAAGHCCDSKQCAVCRHVALAEVILTSAAVLLVALLWLLEQDERHAVFALPAVFSPRTGRTLVGWKVRLNN